MTKPKIYYDIANDLAMYPDAWCYLIWSKRGPGKTYSTLRYCIENNIKFVFMKRTIEDVKIITTRPPKGIPDPEDDPSPFSPLNRDFNWDIYPFVLSKYITAFYHATLDDNDVLVPVGNILGWVVACTAVSKVKGFSMDAADMLIFDEFIPKPWERVNKKEGDSVLDMYETITRDRIKRGRKELKLICLANATSLNNPMFNTLDVTDIAAEMDLTDREYTCTEDGTVLHFIQGNFDEEEGQELTGIQKRMAGTPWGVMAYGGHFGYNDLTNIGRLSLKGYHPVCAVSYKKDTFYIYMKDGNYYMCHSKHNSQKVYNLNRENDQKLFYIEYSLDLREACINGKMLFETFTMYDLIVNYRKYFTL